ncbi:MAG: DUF2828 family protein [Saccharofermentans sp.]|nr:DUF2828 family protein [Saccharofermentans sp.]
MLKYLKEEANRTTTENGAATLRSTMSDCLDFFATAGALRNASEEEILNRFIRAYAEDKDLAIKALFYARDVIGGLGERRLFRVILNYLAGNDPEAVRKNIKNVAHFGRFDDLLSLMDTPCERDVIEYIKETLNDDIKSLERDGSLSLLAKWLPSSNASSMETRRLARKIARGLNMREEEYRKMLSSLRAEIKIIENNLREKDYSFNYEAQPSKALLKYRKAFIRNDGERYMAFIEKACSNPSILHADTLAPYEIVRPFMKRDTDIDIKERMALDATWNALPGCADLKNSLVVVDGSGSMYCGGRIKPIEVAESLGIYFAERSSGAFKDHFITFSTHPKLVKIKGDDICEKIRYCLSYNECSNTNIEATFELILSTAVNNNLEQSDLPERLFIISDMEFDWCTSNADMTNFEAAKAMFEEFGYKLPQIVFWNVNSRGNNMPVRMNEMGVILVSGTSTTVFDMIMDGDIDPYSFMLKTLSLPAYKAIAA